MLKAPILLTGLLVWAATDTLWWRTPGGSVTEQHDPGGATCTLALDGPHVRFAFAWSRSLPTRVIVSRPDWNLVPGQITSVALRIGETWLTDGAGGPALAALTDTQAVRFIPNQPIEPLLTGATGVALRVGNETLTVTLDSHRMAGLLHGLQRCRSAIGG
jgi:hypothetical protein